MSDIYQNFVDKIFAKYRHSPNILKIFEILSDPLQDTSDAIDWILDHLSLDTGEGATLDVLGSWIGVQRPPAQEQDLFRLFRDEEIADDIDNHHGLASDSLTEGGYLSSDDGCLSKSHPGSYMADDEFVEYIRAKAATFREIATPEIMYTYILQFGVRTKLLEYARECQIEPSHYENMNLFLKDHIENKGFRPAGVHVLIKPQTAPDSEI